MQNIVPPQNAEEVEMLPDMQEQIALDERDQDYTGAERNWEQHLSQRGEC